MTEIGRTSPQHKPRIPSDNALRTSLIDESVITDLAPGSIYVIAAAAVLRTDIPTARASAFDAIHKHNGRTRPFHWTREGSRAKAALCEAITRSCERVDIAVVHIDARARQEEARASALTQVFESYHVDGIDIGELLIESRDASMKNRGQNTFDHQTIIEVRHRQLLHPRTEYHWADKSEPLLWMPDAVAGAMCERLRGTSNHLNTIERGVTVVHHDLR